MRNKTEAYINQYKALINTETLQEGSTLYVIGQETATVRRSYLQIIFTQQRYWCRKIV